MSDVSLGEGWWRASDGRWYPPESDRGEEAPLCPNGHSYQTGAAFCSQCGAPISINSPPSGAPTGTAEAAAPIAGIPEVPTGGHPADEAGPQKRALIPSSRAKWVAIAVAVVVVVGAGLAGASALAGSSGSGSRPALTPEQTAYSKCDATVSHAVAQLASINVNDQADLNAAIDNMALQFGAQNPDFTIITNAWSLWIRTAFQQGTSQATQQAKSYIAQQCVQVAHLVLPPQSTNSTTPSSTAPSSTTTTLTPPAPTTSSGPQPAEKSPPGAGGPWQLATAAFVGVLNSSLESDPNGAQPPIPTGYNVWLTQDSNSPSWYWYESDAPADAPSEGDAGPVDTGAGIAQLQNGTWTIVASISNQAPGCYGPNFTVGTTIPSSVLSDFGLSCS